ncbi:MAG TPA: PAS domain S-box protein [Ignavibacteriaceae bacterium]|nr:PAS domain S-box protein [Ignavibacteriaceae bacterium]
MSSQFTNYFPAEVYRIFIEQNPLSIVVTDIHGNIEHVNPKFMELTGYTLDEVLGKNPRILKSGEKSLEAYKILWETILAGEVWTGEFLNKKKDGSLYNEFAIISPLKNQTGEIVNFIAIKEDITELRKTTAELKKSVELATIGKMTAYISHEIKTPLTSIKINVDMLEQNDSISTDAKRSVSIIQKEIKRLKNLLKNILQFTNQQHLYFSRINLFKKIESIHEFLKPLLAERKIVLLNNTSEHYIWGDAQQLRSLFIHLIENSIESINTDGVIEIYSEIKNENCYIYLKDSGCGIDNTKNIFEPFFTTKPAGTGLGLPIAKNIVDKHAGTISLSSSRPGETIFEIILKSMGV